MKKAGTLLEMAGRSIKSWRDALLKQVAVERMRASRARGTLGDRAELFRRIGDAIERELVIFCEPVMALVAFGGRFHVERPGVNRAA